MTKRFLMEQIVTVLKQAELGLSVAELTRRVGISEQKTRVRKLLDACSVTKLLSCGRNRQPFEPNALPSPTREGRCQTAAGSPAPARWSPACRRS